MALLDDIADHLDTNGVATLNTDLFKGALLDSQPDAVTVVFESPGPPNDDTMGDASPAIRHATLQVRGRAEPWDYEAARQRVEDAHDVLVLIANEAINGTTYQRVSHANGPFPIRRDESDRWEFVANFDVSWLP